MKKSKKRVEPVIDIVESVPEPQEPAPKFLTREEMLEIRALDAEARVGDLEARAGIQARDTYLTQIDPEGKLAQLSAQIRRATDLCSESKAAMKQVRENIQKRLGVENLSDYAYDDQTGALSWPDR